MSAIVGVAGLEATYQALRARKRVGLANKETLVAGGRLIMDAVRECGSELIPVDSEHNARPPMSPRRPPLRGPRNSF